MIKHNFRIFLTLILIGIAPAICNAEDEIVHQDLKQMYNDPASKDLRTTFNNYLSTDNKELENISEEQLKLFKEKFIVLQIDQYQYDHYLLNILINPADIRDWNVEIRQMKSGDYKILSIKEVMIKKSSMKNITRFVTKEKLGYWQ